MDRNDGGRIERESNREGYEKGLARIVKTCSGAQTGCN